MNGADLPNDATNSPVATWLNRLKAAVLRRTILAAPGYRIKETPLGFMLELTAQSGAAAPPPTRYRFKSLVINAIKARTWDGTTEGEEDVTIALPFKLRHVAQETINGVVINYTYTTAAPEVRTAQASNGLNEQQFITPPFIVNDDIYAEARDTGVSTSLSDPTAPKIPLMLINDDARAWAAF